jgi:hypothetical protein
MTNNLRIHVPSRRTPRLPRDHFAMQPQISKIQRGMRALVVLALVAYAIALRLHHG